jgi:hypothetical protein
MLVLENWKKVIFKVWIKELYWNSTNYNDIKCNFKALLNIFLHFGMNKIYQRASLLKIQKNIIFFTFPFFLQILPGNFSRVFP